jgi:ribosomal protein L37AE/L43A
MPDDRARPTREALRQPEVVLRDDPRKGPPACPDCGEARNLRLAAGTLECWSCGRRWELRAPF